MKAMSRMARLSIMLIGAGALMAIATASIACPSGRVCSPGKACPPESNCVVPGNPLGQPGTSGDHLGLSADPRSTTTVGDTTVGEPPEGAVRPPEDELERIRRIPDRALRERLLKDLHRRAGIHLAETEKRVKAAQQRIADLHELRQKMREARQLRRLRIEGLSADTRSAIAALLLSALIEIDRLKARLGFGDREVSEPEIDKALSEAGQELDRADRDLKRAMEEFKMTVFGPPNPPPKPGETGPPLDDDEVIMNGPLRPPAARP